MPATLLIMIAIAVLIVLLAVLVFYHSKYCKRRPTDYYNLFMIGVIWLVIGIPLEISPLIILGIVFMGIGLANKDKWVKNKAPPFHKLTKAEQKFRIGLIVSLLVLFIVGIIIFFLVA